MKPRSTLGEEVRLSTSQRRKLKLWQGSSEMTAKMARRARIIQLLADGWGQAEVARSTGAGIATVGRVRRRFLLEGLETSIYGFCSPGRPLKICDAEQSRLVAIACSDPPPGHSKWTIRLLSDHTSQDATLMPMSRESVRCILNRHGLKPWLKKNVVHSSTG